MYVKKFQNVKFGINICAFQAILNAASAEKQPKKAIFRHQNGLQANGYVLEQLRKE